MSPWLWFLLVVAIGGAVLLGAVWFDRSRVRRANGEGLPAPQRGVADVDSLLPSYLTQDEVDALPAPASDDGPVLTRAGREFGFGYAHADFATSRAGAELTSPRILVVDGTVASMRELLGALAWAEPEHPLVLLSAGLAPDVVATLAANRRALRTPVLAAVAGDADRSELAELAGATPLSVADLRAGYVPEQALGVVRTVTAMAARCWVEPNLK